MLANIFSLISYEKFAQLIFETSYNFLVTFCNRVSLCNFSFIIKKLSISFSWTLENYFDIFRICS